MRQLVRYAFRFAAILAATALIPLLLAPASAPGGPYLSALSDAAVAPALAAPGCAFKACPKEPGRKSNCFKTTNATNCVNSTQSGCQSVAC
jgi:hypothetical protein